MAKTHSFTIPIGDWSGDGHSQCRYYQFTSNKPLTNVREAFFKAQQKALAPDPVSFCNDYQDYEVPEDVVETLKELGYTIDPDSFSAEDMADYVAWYIMQADPKIKLERQPGLQMLPFYGYDDKNRHIPCIGYGLLGD